MRKPKNMCEIVSNYCTDTLQSVLSGYGKEGYKIVSVVMAKNRYGVDVMYLFFTLDE